MSPTLRCGALNMAGEATAGFDVQAARSYFTQSLGLARRAREDYHAARALRGLALVGYYTGDREGGSAAGQAAVDLARAMGDPVLLGECLTSFGLAADDPPERKAIFQEALQVTRRSGDRVYTGWSHNNLADSLLAEDSLEAAREHLEQARTILGEVGHPNPVPVVNLGWVHLRNGDLADATADFTEALYGCERAHLRRDATMALLGLACTAAAQREWERAGCLLGFADEELEKCGGSWTDPERTYREESFTQIEARLGAKFDRHYGSGRAGDHSDLIDLALDRQHLAWH